MGLCGSSLKTNSGVHPEDNSMTKSRNDSTSRRSSTESSHKELSPFERRIQDAIKLIIQHTKSGRKRKETGLDSKSFNRIILKFPIIKEAFITIRSVFRRFDEDNNGSIDKNELKSALAALGAAVSDEMVQEMFHEANMDNSESLSFQEFLLTLCIGSVLKLFPLIQRAAREQEEKCPINEQLSEDNIEEQPSVESKDIPVYETPRTHETIESEGAMLMAEAQKMIYGLRLIIEAYILFDDDCDGFIQYEEVIKIIREHSPNAARPHESSQSATGLLSEERWQELDWDKDGRTTFKEFLFAFYKWVGMDDEEEEEQDEEAASLEASVKRNTKMNASSASFAKTTGSVDMEKNGNKSIVQYE